MTMRAIRTRQTPTTSWPSRATAIVAVANGRGDRESFHPPESITDDDDWSAGLIVAVRLDWNPQVGRAHPRGLRAPLWVLRELDARVSRSPIPRYLRSVSRELTGVTVGCDSAAVFDT